jgi:Ser/Thr protein kinase RdoA (MazF antagonist)
MVSQYNGSFYVFFEYIEGDEYAQSREQAYSVGAQLAALHNATLRTSADRFSESILDSFNDLAAISNLVDIEKVQKQAAENFHKIEDYGLYTCVVHGDCNPSNFIFDQAGHVKGIVDFDNVKVDNPIRDIAEAILAFGITRYRNNTSNFENIFNTPNRELCRAILKGYQEHTSDPEMFAKLLPSLTSAIKIIAAEFYVLAFLKKNTLSDPSYSVDGLDLSFLMSSS